MAIAAVILAAGASSRMGRAKQLLQVEGESFVRRAARAARDAGCEPVVVVTGAHADLVRDELRSHHVIECENTEWASGPASSVRSGIAAVLAVDPGASAAVFLVCDQPGVDRGVVEKLLDAYRETAARVVASAYAGTLGVPALFDRSLFDELANVDGSGGAKQVIARHAEEAAVIPFPQGEVDIDTPDDYERLVNFGLPAATGHG
jgi:molybdenum cofactor cytidylyltransferase